MHAEALLAEAEAGTAIIVPNQRAQRCLHRLYDAHQHARRPAWPTPAILSWGAWIDSLWHEYILLPDLRAPVRLNSVQEQILWAQIIKNSEAGRELMSVDAAAQLAREAWRLLQEYCVFDLSLLATTDDGAAFKSWAEAFAAQCEANRWTDQARVAGLLCDAIARGLLRISGRFILVGFDKITPQQERVVASLRACGCTCGMEDWPAVAARERIAWIASGDSTAEIQCAAEWARARLETQPSAQVGIIVPDLESLRERVERIFTEVLVPDALLGGGNSSPLFEISLGRPLARYPIIQAALQLLRWLGSPLPSATAGMLIRSPYLQRSRDDSSEAGRRALLDAAVCREGFTEVSIEDVCRIGTERRDDGRPRPHACFGLAERLQAAQRQLETSAQMPSFWSRHFAALLEAAGWPGNHALSSTEYQACQSWLELLRRLATLDAAAPAMSFQGALTCLERLARTEIFQPENLGAPIQVLGPLEASGSVFDCLWIMGADDERWFAHQAANPLLPLEMQRHYLMPHASITEDLAFAERVTARLCQSAREVVVSYASADGDRSLRLSPLFAAIPAATISDILPQRGTTWIDVIKASAGELEPVCNDPVPVPLPETEVRGGARILQLQAACPFRAFAELRLHAAAMEEPVAGFDPKMRGNLVHAVLQQVWSRLKDSACLQQLTPEAQRELIACCARQALQDQPAVSRDNWFQRLAGLELERLIDVVSAWLELERQRAPFRVIELEKKEPAQIGSLCLELRVDRKDELLDGRGAVILDYKTGALNPSLKSVWYEDRPDEPQLPLYAAVSGARLAALAFAFVRTGDVRFCGNADAENILPGVKPLRDERLEDKVRSWRTILTSLADNFLAGKIDVDPKNEKSCEHCPLPSLCRINQTARLTEIIADAGPGARSGYE
jgi:ATP-dependent helicase/nuclease subunit B